jgi:hypothetical protein
VNKYKALEYISDLISNSNVDIDSDLYRNAVKAMDFINGCDLVDTKTQMAIIWSIEDVQEVRPDLNDEQAGEVLSRVEDIHDCNCGITWDTLSIVADDMFPEADDE